MRLFDSKLLRCKVAILTSDGPGTASYIGRLNLHLSPRNTQRVSLQDMRYEDLALFGKKYPLVPVEAVSFETSKPQR